MEVALSGPQVLTEPVRRGAPAPLSQLVEESRSSADIPNHLLESKIYAKLQSNSVIQAEPPVLHFGGFELEKDYWKILKLINISSEVMNVHVIPTQTKHFQTTFTKKHRLIPGLAYTLKVRFRPDEWRYFYDCVRVHSKGEENLLIPVHAYPVIDDLHVPPRVDLSAVPLGQRVCHVIPLRCSCPIDFEFQVYVLQPHEAFTIHPLTGVVPANGEAKITVTFGPFRYETCEVTIRLTVSQFNTKPYLCTITGSSAPHLALSEPHTKRHSGEHEGPSLAPSATLCRKNKRRPTEEAGTSKTQRVPSAKPGPEPPADKVDCQDPKEGVTRGSTAGLQNRQTKEALFVKRVQRNTAEERANSFRRVHLGAEPLSPRSRRKIAEEREMALQEYATVITLSQVRRGDARPEEDARRPKLSSGRALCEAARAHQGAPSFQFYPSFHRELGQRALALFQQAARKVAIWHRTNRRLIRLKKQREGAKTQPLPKKAEEEATHDTNISGGVFPFAFPVFSDEDDLPALNNLARVPVGPTDATATAAVPFFKLQVPRHSELTGYRPASAWERFQSYVPTTLARPLCTGDSGDPVPTEDGVWHPTAAQEKRQEDGGVAAQAAGLTFSAPEALLRPPWANPLRIFNPAPGLQTYKPTLKYTESDPEFHLRPLSRYENRKCGTKIQCAHVEKKVLGCKQGITGLATWKHLDSMTFNWPSLPSDRAPQRYQVATYRSETDRTGRRTPTGPKGLGATDGTRRSSEEDRK